MYLFSELDRLGILESQFFLDEGRRLDRRELQPDAGTRMELMTAVEQARRHALAKLETNPEDPQALFCLSVASGMMADYIALVQKQRLRSLTYAKQSHSYAVRLLRADPTFHDAYLTTGLSEYLVSRLPFFVRWFVRFEQVRGSKKQAIENLQRVAASGRYLGPFARILLVVIYLRDKLFEPAHELLSELTAQFPGNALFRRELAELSERVGGSTGDREEGNLDGF